MPATVKCRCTAIYEQLSQKASSAQVPDLFPLQVAAWKALTAERRGKLITRTLHSELVFSIAGSTHVRQKYAYCGAVDSLLTHNHARTSHCDADLGKLQAVWGQCGCKVFAGGTV